MQKLIPIIVASGLLTTLLLTARLQSSQDNGKLGPFDSITFSGSEGDLTITNSDKRISWGDEETSQAWSVGFMEIGKALEQLMKADHFTEAREDLNEELDEEISLIRKTLDKIRDRAQSLEPDDPDAPEVKQQWDEAYKKFERLQKRGLRIRGDLASQQMQESYKEVIEAVNVVSDRLNIDIVLRFIPPDGEFEGKTPEATIMQIRLRTALRLPEGIDITDEVLVELGLEVE
ncbi:OmpH family outer membrane protein [PVC group bacterium]|nr:OmpH family outer membrane protein [PVC group bacterium]